MSYIDEFQEFYPSLESYWRSIILFGRNVASYKFALAKSLLEIAPTEKNEISLEELAEPFSRYLCDHIKTSPKQCTSNSSKFLDACRLFNDGEISHDKLIDVTVEKGFNNVIDAFHNVNNAEIPIKFYEKKYNGKNKKLILTDNIFELKENLYYDNLFNEAEARWNLVETAWELGVSKNLLAVKYDETDCRFFVNNQCKRKVITSARGALNGYQKGKCFYCFDDITVSADKDDVCDVDHFFPFCLQPFFPDVNLNGVWNLVLACPMCNRGTNGKFAKIPSIKYMERLHRRNEFLINSHHPLRETIISQTGKTEAERAFFLKSIDQRAINLLIHRWSTEQIGEAIF